MKKVVVVTPPDAMHGFALAGVRHMTTDPDVSMATLLELARDAQTGVLIIDERLVTKLVREWIRALDSRWPGLAIVLPAPRRGQPAEEDYVLQLIRRAIGYQVRLT